LGNGFYYLITPDLFQNEKAPWRTPPRLFAQLDLIYADNATATFITDRSWKLTTRGPIRFNCVRGGETIDHNFELGAWLKAGYDDTAWSSAIELAPPRGKLQPQTIPPIRVDETAIPVAITEPAPGLYIADYGRNLVGVVRFSVAGIKGARVTLDFNERLRADGTLDTGYAAFHTYGRYQRQIFILNGKDDSGQGEVFEARFTYHAFRYVQIQGLTHPPRPEDLVALRFHTALERSGSLVCANPQLNTLHDAARRTLEDCTFGTPCSEPVREKIGWNGDPLFDLDAYFYLFNATTLYRKMVKDIVDGQEANGHILPITQSNGWGKLDSDGGREYCDDPWWGGTLADSVRGLVAFQADLPTLRQAYEATRRYVTYLTSTAQQHIVSWSIGDWCDSKWRWPEGPGLTPVPLTSTLGYYRYAKLASSQAKILGRHEDADHYERLANQIRSAFNARFYHSDSATYHEGSQSAQALALFTGAVPADDQRRVLDTLVREIVAADGHLTTGFIGLLPTLYTLVDHGYVDLAYEAVTKPTGSGWFFMFDLTGDPPTLGECIHPHVIAMGTCHHQFAAGVAGYLYRCLAGIRPDPASPGFKHVIIRPAPPRDLAWLEATHCSVRGPIRVAWKQKDGAFRLEVTIPANTTATVFLPSPQAEEISESGVPLATARGVKQVRVTPAHTQVMIQSGSYAFVVPHPQNNVSEACNN
jgi:alpha-L-rhamnosidase